MSELREECYKCLNNQTCPSCADYGSIICMTKRKYEMPKNREDSVYAIRFAVMQQQINEKDKRIKELEEALLKVKDKNTTLFITCRNSIPKQKVKDVLQNNRNELFSTTYIDDKQYKPYTMQIDRINKIENELLEDK